jgi:hypothetical protein
MKSLSKADQAALIELDKLDEQLVQEVGKRAEKKAEADAKPIGPYEGAPRRLMLEEHADNLSKGKDLKDPPTTKEQLDQLDGRFKALANAHQEVRLYLEAIKPPNKPTDEVKGQIDKVMGAMRDEEAALFTKYRDAREAIKAMPVSPEKTTLMRQADQTFAKVSSFLTQNILPQAAEFQQKVKPEELVNWHMEEVKTALPVPPPSRREDLERAMVVGMNKIERAIDEVKRIQDKTGFGPDTKEIGELKNQVKMQMDALKAEPYVKYFYARPDDGTKEAKAERDKTDILRNKLTGELPAKLQEIGMGPAPAAPTHG